MTVPRGILRITFRKSSSMKPGSDGGPFHESHDGLGLSRPAFANWSDLLTGLELHGQVRLRYSDRLRQRRANALSVIFQFRPLEDHGRIDVCDLVARLNCEIHRMPE